MMTPPPFGSSSFKLVARGLVALHRLIKDGKDDSPEAEAVRDALDVPLKALSKTEKERAQWLSEDLYSVSEPLPAADQKAMNPQAQQQFNEAIEARQNREWDRALALLRRWRDDIAPALLSYLRGSIWSAAGNFDVATAFYGHASESDPASEKFRETYLHTLEESDPHTARKLAEEVLAEAENYSPLIVARAVGIRINEIRSASTIHSAQLYAALIPILEKNLARIEKDEDVTGRMLARVMTFGLLGFSHERQGNAGVAVDYFTRAIEITPDDEGLIVARGTLQYGTSPRAIADFQHAVVRDFPMVSPYLFLAHHYLITHQFESCRTMCENGVRRQGSHTAKSRLEEWRAIAQAELGFSPDLVRSAFETALRLDPSNDLARRNQATFEESLKVPQTSFHLKWHEQSEAAVRQFGIAERRFDVAA